MTDTDRPRSRTLTVAGRVVPGIARVHDQVGPYAAAWRASNVEALASNGPLWVALGDSMTQGIGARSIRSGWVGQVQSRLTQAGTPYRVINLSATGARIYNVLHTQLAELRSLPQLPDVLTILVGANDMVRRSRRAAAVDHFGQLLAGLPVGPRVVAATLPRRNAESLEINRLIEAAQRSGQIDIADMRGMQLRDVWGTLADDFFHPNERGYARIANAFFYAIAGDT
jgi:lysophospholipase L1-like esterase